MFVYFNRGGSAMKKSKKSKKPKPAAVSEVKIKAVKQRKKREAKSRLKARKFRRNADLCNKVAYILAKYFPSLAGMIKEIKDNVKRRRKNVQLGIFMRILAAIFHIDSMKSLDIQFNDEIVLQNILKLFGTDDIKKVPSGQTINEFIKSPAPLDIEVIITQIVEDLVSMKAFAGSTFREHWKMIIDAVTIHI
jgi:hypothetical protein